MSRSGDHTDRGTDPKPRALFTCRCLQRNSWRRFAPRGAPRGTRCSAPLTAVRQRPAPSTAHTASPLHCAGPMRQLRRGQRQHVPQVAKLAPQLRRLSTVNNLCQFFDDDLLAIAVVLLPGTDTSPLTERGQCARAEILPVAPRGREEQVVSRQPSCVSCVYLYGTCAWDGLYQLFPRPVHAKISHRVTSKERHSLGRYP